MKRRSVIWLLGAAFCCLQVCAVTEAAATKAHPPVEYTLAVFPFLPCSNLEGIFAPIAAELSQALGKPVHFRVTPTFDDFTASLKEQKFDIVHIHPFDYVQYGRTNGYQPLVARSEVLYAAFSAKDGSPVRRLSDLRGKRLGTPPRSGAVTYMARAALLNAGIKPEELTVRHFANHLACLQQLQIGSVDACATSAPAVRVFEAQLGIRLQPIGRSKAIPHVLFAAHSRIPAADREKIRAALLASTLSTVEPTLRALFIEPGSSSPGRYFSPVSDRDYEPARRILKKLMN